MLAELTLSIKKLMVALAECNFYGELLCTIWRQGMGGWSSSSCSGVSVQE